MEPPYGWIQTDKPVLLFLPIRGDTLSNGCCIHWEAATDSYAFQQTTDVFALQATPYGACAASRQIVDDGVGLDLTFASPDKTVEAVYRGYVRATND